MTKMIFFTAACVIAMASGCSQYMAAYAQTSYTNPIVGGDYPDPSIIRDGDDYYMTHSAFDYVPGLLVLHSKDLVNWEPIGSAVNEYLGSIWAPDISKCDCKYYIYFTVDSKPQTNYVVWAESPYGPWSEPIDLKIGGIDPCLAVDDNGGRWLFLSGGAMVKLSDDGLSIVSEPKYVYGGWPYPEDWKVECFCMEGPKVKRFGDYYYYLSAEGGTAGPATSHMVTQARAKSLDGPWENAPNNPLIHTYSDADRWWSKGHGSIVDTPDGDCMIVYHAYENGYYNLGRQTLLEPVWMGEDGWFHSNLDGEVAKNTIAETALMPQMSPLPEHITDDIHDALGEFRIGKEWRFYKRYDKDRVEVVNDTLIMQGLGQGIGESYPLFFIAGDHSYEIDVDVEIEGDATAGLVLLYDNYDFVASGLSGYSVLHYRDAETVNSVAHPDGDTKRLSLKIRNDGTSVKHYYSYDGQNWITPGWKDNVSNYHHNNLGQFQSLVPGLYVFGEGKARFSNFKYTRLR